MQMRQSATFAPKGKTVEILANYEPSPHYVSEWWKQNYGESEGKGSERNLPGICRPDHRLIPWDSSSRTATGSLYETAMNVEESKEEIIIQEELVVIWMGLNYLAGKNGLC